MTFVDKIRGRWARRITVAALAAVLLPGIIGFAGGSATAGAFSRPGLPVEYLMVPSAVDGPRHQDPVPEGHRVACGVPARRSARARRLQRLGHRDPGVRVVLREPAVGRDAGRRPVELLHRLVSAGVRQRRLPDLQVGDVPDRRAAAVAGLREGRVPERQRGGRPVDVRQLRDDPGGVPPGRCSSTPARCRPS